VTQLDREAVLGTLGRVLARDPAAVEEVRELLVARRDEASAALAYERAAQVQAELGALEWLVAEQKVTVPGPVTYDVAGWSAGTLVLFGVHEGCLTSWTRRSCPESAARGPVAATPSAWVPFARRNAELAAALVGAPGADP
jgi:excinuclease ABC subunit C